MYVATYFKEFAFWPGKIMMPANNISHLDLSDGIAGI